MARAKFKQIVLISNLEEANQVLADLGAINREISLIRNACEEQIDTVKNATAISEAPFLAKKKQLEASLSAYALMNKAELFDDSKTKILNFGNFGFRLSTRLCTFKGIKWEMILDKLKQLGRGGIRVKEEIDKEDLRKWPDEKLALIGVEKKQEDSFWYEVKGEN